MSTFQAAVHGVVYGFTVFLPVSARAHQILVNYVLGWPAPTGALQGALALGALLALLIHFRHDWASMVSCTLQIVIYRRKPMTLDERMPLFILLATLPAAGAWYYFHDTLAQFDWSPLLVAGLLAGFGLPLKFAESFGRKTKGIQDWNWLDALIAGAVQSVAVVPGFGHLTALFTAGCVRNYNREAAAKFAFFALTPLVAASAFTYLHDTDFHAAQAMADVSWLSYGVAFVVSLIAGLLAIGGFMKQLQRRGIGQYVVYRWVAALAIAAFYFFHK